MKFYFRGVIWDKEKNKRLCEADDGVLETEDERVIRILRGMDIKEDKKPEPSKVKTVKRRKPKVVIPEGVSFKEGKR